MLLLLARIGWDGARRSSACSREQRSRRAVSSHTAGIAISGVVLIHDHRPRSESQLCSGCGRALVALGILSRKRPGAERVQAHAAAELLCHYRFGILQIGLMGGVKHPVGTRNDFVGSGPQP
jgi:hypothetical protein